MGGDRTNSPITWNLVRSVVVAQGRRDNAQLGAEQERDFYMRRVSYPLTKLTLALLYIR